MQPLQTFAISSNMCMLLGKRCKSSEKSSKTPAKRFKGNKNPHEKIADKLINTSE